MPSSHRRYATWTPQRMMNEAAKIGPATIALVEAIMKAKPHPEQGFRSCLGIMRLVRTYGTARVEAASRRGNDIGATTYGSIASILKTGLDTAYANSKAPDGPPILGGTRFDNLFLNTGSGHMGWTMACGSSRLVTDLMLGRKPDIPLQGMTLDRY